MESKLPLLTLTNVQARQLAGQPVTIGMESFRFKDYDPIYPGRPPWRSGAEGKAYPLLDYEQSVVAYLKFFTRPTLKRRERTAWLIARQLHAWLPGLAGAPLLWTDTRHPHRPEAAALDFAGYLAPAVPGKTWLELKQAIAEGSLRLTDEFRWRCVCDLVLALAVLEQEVIVHGDLSPNNTVVDLDSRPGQPALYLIDFDAFVAPAAGENRMVTVAEGGTYGTDGYCPPDLVAASVRGEDGIAPYSDRHGRDMLVLELLAMDEWLSPDDPPSSWGVEQLERACEACRSRVHAANRDALPHLSPATVLRLEECDRPGSIELAAGLGLVLPPRQPLKRVHGVKSSVPAVLDLASPPQTTAAQQQPAASMSRRAPTMARFNVPWRLKRPEGDPYYRSLWQDLRVAAVLAVPLLALLAMGLYSIFFR